MYYTYIYIRTCKDYNKPLEGRCPNWLHVSRQFIEPSAKLTPKGSSKGILPKMVSIQVKDFITNCRDIYIYFTCVDPQMVWSFKPFTTLPMSSREIPHEIWAPSRRMWGFSCQTSDGDCQVRMKEVRSNISKVIDFKWIKLQWMLFCNFRWDYNPRFCCL